MQDASGIPAAILEALAALRADNADMRARLNALQSCPDRGTEEVEVDAPLPPVPNGIPPPWAGERRTSYYAYEPSGYILPRGLLDTTPTVSGYSLDRNVVRRLQSRYPCPFGTAIGTTPTADDMGSAASQQHVVKAVVRDLHISQECADWTARAILPALHTARTLLRHVDPDTWTQRHGTVSDDAEGECDTFTPWPEESFDNIVASVQQLDTYLTDALALNRHHLARVAHNSRLRTLEVCGYSGATIGLLERYPSGSHEQLIGNSELLQQLRREPRPKAVRGGNGRRVLSDNATSSANAGSSASSTGNTLATSANPNQRRWHKKSNQSNSSAQQHSSAPADQREPQQYAPANSQRANKRQ